MATAASSDQLPRIYSHNLESKESAQALGNALAWLRPHLPVSVPLYRRLQFGRFLPATLLLTNLSLETAPAPQSQNGEKTGNEVQDEEPWFVAFLDRSCRPETEVWFFGSWEAAAFTSSSATMKTTANTTNGTAQSSGNEEKITQLMQALLLTLKALPLPQSIHLSTSSPATSSSASAAAAAPTTDSVGLSLKDYGGHIANPAIVLWGGIHASTVPFLEKLGVVSTAHKTSLMPNWTFVWDVDALAHERAAGKEFTLPQELRWGELSQKDFALVRARTQIPRQERTLAVLPNVAIFPKVGEGEGNAASPVGWGFVGLDASLTSLHVEKEWRARGLAKAITTKVFAEKMERFWEEGTTKWAFGYVIVGNKESEGMCRSLGGKSSYESFWVRVDLEKA